MPPCQLASGEHPKVGAPAAPFGHGGREDARRRVQEAAGASGAAEGRERKGRERKGREGKERGGPTAQHGRARALAKSRQLCSRCRLPFFH